MRSNFFHLYADVVWYGVLAGSAIAFIAIYITRLGANAFQVSLLTAGPAVVNLLFSLPAGRWLENRAVITASFWSALWHRLGYMIIIFLPWLFIGRGQVMAVVWVTLLMSVPGTILAISFNAAFADIVPPESRGDVVGKRNALLAVSMTLTTLLCGWLLDWITFPLNYQIVFGLGAYGGLMSTFHLSRLRQEQPNPVRVNQPIGDLVRPGTPRFVDTFRLPAGLRFLTRRAGKPLLRLDLLRSSFGPFMAAYLLFYTFQYLPLPLFPLTIVRSLKLSDGTISLGNGIFYLSMFLVSLRLGRVSGRFSHRRILVASAFLYGLYPLLIGLAKGPELYLLAALEGGSVWALVSAALINRLMERVPEDERPAHMALHNLTLNLGILAGSLAGPFLSLQIGLQPALLIGAGLRFLAGVFLLLWG
jgi:MFS family permease